MGYSSIITRLVRLTQEQVVAEIQLVVQPNGVLGPWVARGTKDKGGLSWRSEEGKWRYLHEGARGHEFKKKS